MHLNLMSNSNEKMSDIFFWYYLPSPCVSPIKSVVSHDPA